MVSRGDYSAVHTVWSTWPKRSLPPKSQALAATTYHVLRTTRLAAHVPRAEGEAAVLQPEVDEAEVERARLREGGLLFELQQGAW